MAFSIPNFNLAADTWYPGNAPPMAPDVTTDCQLRAAGKSSTGQDSSSLVWPFLWAVLVPAGTDIRDANGGPTPGLAEVPAGSGRFYTIEHVDDVARGFSNEYRIGFLRKTAGWPQPIP